MSFTQLALGAEIDVPTLYGIEKFTIPEGTQSGTVFKLKGKGIKHLRSNNKGDQYFRVMVVIPKKLTQKQKELLQQFAEMSGEENLDEKKTFFEKVKNLFKE